ncbi:MAG: DUF1572 domain-containing protein [Chitinophagaceae bacterium]|nr:MAG: DUF1572 domain-containing protein [Chitinophagaceae bacterium]
MNASLLLANRFREVILNGTFVANTNLKEQLTGTSYLLATQKTSELNTIAALAQHLHYYVKGVLEVLQGGPLAVHDKDSFDFPPVNSQEQWEIFLNKFFTDAEHFAVLVEALPEEKLDAVFVKEKYGDYRRNINAIIEHCYYHFGQIVMLKKLQEVNEDEKK